MKRSEAVWRKQIDWVSGREPCLNSSHNSMGDGDVQQREGAQRLIGVDMRDPMRCGELRPISKRRHAPRCGALRIQLQTSGQWRRVAGAERMGPQQEFERPDGELRILVIPPETAVHRRNFDMVRVLFDCRDGLNLTKPILYENELPAVVVNRPLVLHLSRDE